MVNNIYFQVFKKTGLTKSTLAGRMGVSRAYITQLLGGRANPTLRNLKEFCEHCGFQISIKYKKKKKTETTALPEEMKALFWDAELSRIDPVRHRQYVLHRILTRGGLRAVSWMQSNYTRRQVINFISKHKNRLDKKSLNYWAVVFNKEDKWKRDIIRNSSDSWRNLRHMIS